MNLNEKFDAMRTAYDLAFAKAFEGTPSCYEQFAMAVGDAAHSVVKLPFLEQFAHMRKWMGSRVIKNLSGKMLAMTEDSYEDTIGINVRELETDNWTMYLPAIQQMAVASKAIWDRLALEALTNPAKWIDNKAFFATDRKYDKSVICNKTTDALSHESFKAAYSTMGGYKGHANEPLAVVPDTLMVGPALQFKAKAILENEFIKDETGNTTVSNECRNLAKLIVNPRLVGAAGNNWYLMCCNGPIKPVAVQKSKESGLVSKNAPTDEGVFMGDQAVFGTAAYGSAAAAFPHLVFGGILN